MHPEELDDYLDEIEKLKSESTVVRVKTGIEIDYIPGTERKLEQLLRRYSFDYVIGSIHFMNHWDFTHPVYADTYKERDIDALYQTYFELVNKACRSGYFDIIGHLDVIKKFGFKPAGDLGHYWQQTVDVLAETGTCFELNTAGRDAPVGQFYPDRKFIELALLKGVPLCTGSDAHGPEQVGRYFDEAGILLREIGCRELATFTERKRSNIALDL